MRRAEGVTELIPISDRPRSSSFAHNPDEDFTGGEPSEDRDKPVSSRIDLGLPPVPINRMRAQSTGSAPNLCGALNLKTVERGTTHLRSSAL